MELPLIATKRLHPLEEHDEVTVYNKETKAFHRGLLKSYFITYPPSSIDSKKHSQRKAAVKYAMTFALPPSKRKKDEYRARDWKHYKFADMIKDKWIFIKGHYDTLEEIESILSNIHLGTGSIKVGSWYRVYPGNKVGRCIKVREGKGFKTLEFRQTNTTTVYGPLSNLFAKGDYLVEVTAPKIW